MSDTDIVIRLRDIRCTHGDASEAATEIDRLREALLTAMRDILAWRHWACRPENASTAPIIKETLATDANPTAARYLAMAREENK